MSSVRMCDKCGSIFKEGEIGSGSFNGTVVQQDKNGHSETVNQFMDVCCECNLVPRTAIVPAARLSLG